MYSEAAKYGLGASRCPFCKANCFREIETLRNQCFYICPTCGKFIVSNWTAIHFAELDDLERSDLYKISFQLRRISENAAGKRDKSLFPEHSEETLERWRKQADFSVQEKLSLLLKFLGRASRFPGQEQRIDLANDYALVCARNSEEYKFYCESLADQGLIIHKPKAGPDVVVYALAASGWHELDMLNCTGVESSNAFIAMWFDPSRDVFNTAISSAIKSAGYTPVRIDRVEHVNRIDDEIIAQIRGSKFLVSDFTGQRNGVYFEAGLMLGLGRPVIWLCEQEDLKNVHFDTRQYNTIDYKDAFDLQKRLQFRIEAILGKGPHKPD